MALIASFEERPLAPQRIHGRVACGYRALKLEGKQILQLETYGSKERVLLGKASQTIQLDEEGARTLKHILDAAFPGL